MRIGVLTGGGDCPGLNAVIRAVVRKGEGVYGHSFVGYRHDSLPPRIHPMFHEYGISARPARERLMRWP